MMLGHYFAFLAHYNRCFIFVITEMFARWNNIVWPSTDKSNRSTLSLSMNMIIPLLNWLCIKYHYHFPTELLIMVLALFIGTIAYFYDFFVPGTPNFYNIQYTCKLHISFHFQEKLTGMRLNNGCSQL